MHKSLKLVIWNANGLIQHKHEIIIFLELYKIDIMLISETHLTTKSYVNFPNYYLYHTDNPSGLACGGTAVLINKNIKHQEFEKYQKEKMSTKI